MKVGIVSEQAMAKYIRNNVSRENSILTDNAQTYATMMLTGQPEALSHGIDGVEVLGKPFRPAQLIDAVARLVAAPTPVRTAATAKDATPITTRLMYRRSSGGAVGLYPM